MSPRELPAAALDADNTEAEILSSAPSMAVPATDEIVEAEARAEAARARAIRLRQQADAADNAVAQEEPGERTPALRRRRWRPRWRRPSRKALAFAAAFAVSCAALAASGYLASQHRDAQQERKRTAEFAAAARESVTALLTVGATTARADVQRFADTTTGEFKAGVLINGEQFVKAAEQSKSSTKGVVQGVAVQSMSDNSATVLVAAKSEVTGPDRATPTIRPMRIVVSVLRDGGQLKISKVEFVP